MRVASLALSASLCCLAGSPAFASTWYFFSKNDDQLNFFDADAVEKSDKNVTVWTKQVQIEQPDVDGSWATAVHWKINCFKRTGLLLLATSTYDKNDKLIQTIPWPDVEFPATPDSGEESLINMVCEPTFPHDASSKKYVKVPGNDIFQYTKLYVEHRKSSKNSAPK